MGLVINDKDKCACGAYWQTNGYCANGHSTVNKVLCPTCGEQMCEVVCQNNSTGWLCSAECRVLLSGERLSVHEYNIRKAYLKKR